MAISSYPFDGQAATETEYSRLFRELQTSGVAASADSSAFRVTADSSGMNVKAAPGFALLRGHAVQSTAVETIAIGAADTSARTDRIVLRLDPAANAITLAVVKGVPGGGVPALTQTDTGLYEIPLALVSVGASVTTITAASVEDARPFLGMHVGAWSTPTRPTSPRLGTLGFNRTTQTWEFWTGSAWAALAPTVTWSNVADKPGAFPASPHMHRWSEITDPPASLPPAAHTHGWPEITGKPDSYPPASHSHSWSSISGRPSSFPPESHSHSSYLESGDTIAWANGTKRAHAHQVGGSGTYYAVWVDGSGNFGRNTSSRRYKKNVRDAGISPASVLALTPRVYDRRDFTDPEGTLVQGRRDELGLIAEEVAETLPEVVCLNEHGEIETVRYDLLGVALLPVVQDQEQRIRALEAKLREITE
ncbi:tail fiber domain-containing protein [Streptomyces sp. VNUA116]|uniref:tail fiber domain-containing protein n=1 Tax=Streptomyces sp. VNUA116 TaxID=3062449 RepID=UPI002674BB85|nr:tail fiber domain-containing protein [Streptomyces sp. VNUA116]WKU46735.1 tail fiber domain-containing protein [Streptomyces sp. VNUA116]